MPLRLLEADQIMMLEGAAVRPSRFARLEAEPRSRGARFGSPARRVARRATTPRPRLSGARLGMQFGDPGVGLGDVSPMDPVIVLRDAIRARRAQIGRGQAVIGLGYPGEGAVNWAKDRAGDAWDGIQDGVDKLQDAYNWSEEKVLSFTEDVLDVIEKYGCKTLDNAWTERVTRAAVAAGACITASCAAAPGADEGVQEAVAYARGLCENLDVARAAVDAAQGERVPGEGVPTYAPPSSRPQPRWMSAGKMGQKRIGDTAHTLTTAAQRRKQIAETERRRKQKQKTVLLVGGGVAAAMLLLV